MTVTEQLRLLLIEQRGSTIARYPGMDGYAQDEADAGGPAFRGPYAFVAGIQADTPSEAARLIGDSTNGYDKIGIGFHDGYWVIILN